MVWDLSGPKRNNAIEEPSRAGNDWSETAEDPWSPRLNKALGRGVKNLGCARAVHCATDPWHAGMHAVEESEETVSQRSQPSPQGASRETGI